MADLPIHISQLPDLLAAEVSEDESVYFGVDDLQSATPASRKLSLEQAIQAIVDHMTPAQKAAISSAGTSGQNDLGNQAGPALAVDYSSGFLAKKFTATGNVTVTITPPNSPGRLSLVIYQDLVGGRQITLPTMIGGTVVLNQTAGASCIVNMYYDGTNIFLLGSVSS